MADALTAAVNSALEEAWNDFSAYVASRLDKEITDDKWPWPTGESPRDIVDRGDLRRSMVMKADGKALVTTYRYTAPYAPVVHDGAVFKATDAEGNPRTLTARPWTRGVMRDSPTLRRYFTARFQLAMNRRGRGGARP